MLAALALAVVAWTAGPAMARPHGGGGHGGGGHGGGFGHGGFGHGGFGHGGFGHGGFGHGGFGHRGFGYGGWGYYPGYSYGYSYPGYGYSYPSAGYGYSGPAPVIVDSTPTPAEPAQNYTYIEHRDGDNIGRVHLHVPASAKVWVDGEATKQKGSDRDFMTPPLRSGQEFTYTFKARWNQDGRNVERTKQVRVKANDTAKVDFTAPKKVVERAAAK
jgi:uncharacterized protein (TIGR03000 family)